MQLAMQLFNLILSYILYITGTYCSDLHKMVYLQNRRYLPIDSPLRREKRGFPVRDTELLGPPVKRAYNCVRDHQVAFEHALKTLVH